LKRGNSRPAIGLERILRIHFAPHRVTPSDFPCEEALCDSGSLRRFVEIGLSGEAVPDVTTLLKFGRLPETHELGDQLSGEVLRIALANAYRSRRRLLKKGFRPYWARREDGARMQGPNELKSPGWCVASQLVSLYIGRTQEIQRLVQRSLTLGQPEAVAMRCSTCADASRAFGHDWVYQGSFRSLLES
jgi:hypothetical protein